MERHSVRRAGMKYSHGQLEISKGTNIPRVTDRKPSRSYNDMPLDYYLRELGIGIIRLPGRICHYVQNTIERLAS